MKSKNIVFLSYPNRIVVCESYKSGFGNDPWTNELYEYARIVRFCEPTNFWETNWEFAGDIEWTKRNENMLSDKHRKEIIRFASEMKRHSADAIKKAKQIQKQNLKIFGIWKKKH